MDEISVILSSIGSLRDCCNQPLDQTRQHTDRSCELDCDCPKLLRQLFYQLWHASETSFRNQQEAMKLFCSRAHFEAHVEEHADLTYALTNIMAGYRMSRCCHDVFDDIEKLSEKLKRHQQTLDADLFFHLRQAGVPQERTSVMMAGSVHAPA